MMHPSTDQEQSELWIFQAMKNIHARTPEQKLQVYNEIAEAVQSWVQDAAYCDTPDAQAPDQIREVAIKAIMGQRFFDHLKRSRGF